MIVRDEARVLAECIGSIRDVVDEIVVVDTGSADDSRRIALGHGARVSEFPWTGDFAAARNEALRLARGRWILSIDADERLRDAERADVDALLEDATAVAHTVRFRPRTGSTRYREYRIFRNDPRIRFRGVIHETMLPAVLEVAERDGLRIGHSRLAIDHVGYDGDQRGKHERNVPLLRARLATDPGHVYSWHHLGRALAGLGDLSGAERAWRHGVEAVRRKSVTTAIDSLPYLSLIQHELERGVDTDALVAEAHARFPRDLMLTWLRGRALMAAGRFEEAVALLGALACVDADALCTDAVAYDARIFGRSAFEALALCHFRLGRFEESAAWYERVVAEAPAEPEYRVKLELARARARRGPG